MYENSHEAGQLAVVPVEFEALFSTEMFSFANGTGLDKFILTCSQSRLVRVDDEIDVLPLRRLVLFTVNMDVVRVSE